MDKIFQEDQKMLKKTIQILAIIILSLPMLPFSLIQPIVNADNVSSIQSEVNRSNFLDYFVLSGSATYNNSTGIVVLTPDQNDQVGNMTLNSRISMDNSFKLVGAVYLGNKLDSRGGADGIGFAFHPNGVGDVGYTGANMGIGGLPNAVGFKLDTYYNTSYHGGGNDGNHQLGWDDDPTTNGSGGQGRANTPFGAIVTTNQTGYVTTDSKNVQYLNKNDVLNANISRQETQNGNDALIAKGDNQTGFVGITFSYDGTKHVLTTMFDGLTWTQSIDSSASLAMALSGSTGGQKNLQEFRFDSFEYTEATKVTGAKTWNDSDNQDGLRPDKITVNLLANGKVFDSQTVTTADNWQYTFDNLPVLDANGKEIVYTIAEDKVDGYITSVDGYDLTNTHKTEVTSVTGTKTWNDSDNQDGLRPDKITVNLLANGKVFDSQTVTTADNWQYAFTGLPKFENGKEIVYTIAEDKVDGYITSVDGYDLTNTHKTGSVIPDKTWKNHDQKNNDHIQKKLPNTGERKTGYEGFVGLLLIIISLSIFIFERKKSV
ncbi:MAG TPA: Cna B-type domain-containing protein [Lactobacillaceae bacterium]